MTLVDEQGPGRFESSTIGTWRRVLARAPDRRRSRGREDSPRRRSRSGAAGPLRRGARERPCLALGIVRNRAIDALRRASRPAPSRPRRRGAIETQPAVARTRRGDSARDRRAPAPGTRPPATRAVAGDRAGLLRGFSHSRSRDGRRAARTIKWEDALAREDQATLAEASRRRNIPAPTCDLASRQALYHERYRDDLAAYALGALRDADATS